MPRDMNIKKVLVIGSGPIVIGQAAEFDYAGTQACRVLREESIEIVLINSNPATIMTDNNMADHIYIEPLTIPTIKRIIEKERPDSILSGLGGQTGLTLSMKLAKEGYLDKMGVRLLGSLPETIDRAEDRQIFKDTMIEIGEPVIPSVTATDVDAAVAFANKIGYPVIIRPAFTMGGAGGGSAKDEAQLREIASGGIAMSPIGQVLVEKSIAGWKEIEFECMRDRKGNVITICSMENVDPVGVHTGDSIVVAPCLTLADKELQMLRSASLKIVESLGVEGGCNVQIALDPNSFEYGIIEVNPRVSRSSALASKATGYPIAKVSTKIAIGYTLDEIINAVTGTTYAAYEPTLDYVAVKLPRWPFDKFVYANKELGTQMKATGEVMAIADNFEEALLKAIRGAELGLTDLNLPRLENKNLGEIYDELNSVTDQRLFVLYAAVKRNFPIDQLFDITKVDRWFLNALKRIAKNENTPKKPLVYKMVDTCAGEFEAKTPYFYSIENGTENEALPFIERSKKERIVVLGSGPIRIGQGIEFDYACVHSVWALKEMGYEVIVINNNPETVSTDFDTADRLYFEPLYIDDVMNIINMEKPIGVIVAFGGGTAIKLTQALHDYGVPIIGTSADSIDVCEDRARFDVLLENLNIKRPAGMGVFTEREALDAADQLGYPVLMRPSYVLGGQNMVIANTPEDILEYMKIILRSKQDNPVLIDKYLQGKEIEVDAICDGTDVLIPGIMEHIERTGVHSGDSIAVYPAVNINDNVANKLYDITRKLCLALDVRGLINIQYVLYEKEIYVIEVNPRASRTVPYISKVTGIPMCALATQTAVGKKLADLGYTSGIAPTPPYTAVKVPVFSFEKLVGVDTHLGPEMKSTGEVLGLGKDITEALYKGLMAAGYPMKHGGGVLITVRDSDQPGIAETAGKFVECGFNLFATRGTAKVLAAKGYPVHIVDKMHVNPVNNPNTLMDSGLISYVVCTADKGRNPADDDVKIRRKACILGIPCLTSIDTAKALADSLLSSFSAQNTELIDINAMRSEPLTLSFTKMHGCGNDYIYFDCFNQQIDAPESLAVMLSHRYKGIGGDGIVLIMPAAKADAKMRIFNADGTESAMSGNAIRCVAKYLFDNNIVHKREMQIETGDGTKSVAVQTVNAKVSSATVNMGMAKHEPDMIKSNLLGSTAQLVPIGGAVYEVTCLTLSQMHCVVFRPDVDFFDVPSIGKAFDLDPSIPTGANIEFVEVVARNHLNMRVYESSTSQEAKASSIGACAAGYAAVLNGYCDANEDIRVQLPGGVLMVKCMDDAVVMTGDCLKVFDGMVSI